MKYYQADFLNQKLTIENVKLFISSPPIAMLSGWKLAMMFGRIGQYMREDGIVLIDIPAGYRPETIDLAGMGQSTGWLMSAAFHLVKNAWLNEDHIFHIFRQYRDGFPSILPTRVLEKCNTSKSHPTEFNPKVIRQLIKFYSDVGDTVLDGFCGTGTVMNEAKRLGRVGIGVDIRPCENLRMRCALDK